MNDRFYALSGLGYGRANTPGEAIENYVEAQMRSLPAASTIYGTPKKWEKALRTGDAKAQVWLVPEGTVGHVQGSGLQWISEGPDGENIYTPARGSERLDFTPEHLEWMAGFPPECDSVTFSREQIEAWVGFTLTDQQLLDLEETAPNSSIPDAFAAIATEGFGWSGPDEEV